VSTSADPEQSSSSRRSSVERKSSSIEDRKISNADYPTSASSKGFDGRSSLREKKEKKEKKPKHEKSSSNVSVSSTTSYASKYRLIDN
jgi:hypothetical protein